MIMTLASTSTSGYEQWLKRDSGAMVKKWHLSPRAAAAFVS